MKENALKVLNDAYRRLDYLEYFDFEYSKYTFYYCGAYFGYVFETRKGKFDEDEYAWGSFDEMLDSRIDEFGKTMREALEELPPDAIYVEGVSPERKTGLDPEERRAFFDDLNARYQQETDAVLQSLDNALEILIKGNCYLFRYCPPGTFMMGSPESEPWRKACEYQHEISLTHEFWTMETPVTQALWLSITGVNPSWEKGSDLPVTCITWDDCNNFVRRLNAEGYAPEGMRFSLPTEAQWEYACRAGTTTPFSFGETLNGDRANSDGKRPYPPETTPSGVYIGGATPVKSYPPNPWGLYDMHGNVSEWCADWFGVYPKGPVVDPLGPTEGDRRIMRGGGWDSLSMQCRSAHRDYGLPSTTCYWTIGFRLVLMKTDEPSTSAGDED